ncbi:MAG: 5-formyltetrahydrofolate cyclo-ligase [Verrucomicrobia bacterium]|nr:5-formyltetrahydrofolate cyclo-ligase [Verrucomicrobiota bacterium]
MNEPLSRAKANLRQQVRERLNALTSQQREAGARKICSRLRLQTIWQSADTVLFFAPLRTEPDIWPLLEEALVAGRTVALPRFSAPTQNYVACVVRNLETDLRSGQFGIREPVASCAEIPLNRLDLVLVPGLGFDRNGRRLGRGKGFYDRLLATVPGTKCGIAFDEQMVDAVPVGPLDVCLNCILTPKRWIET